MYIPINVRSIKVNYDDIHAAIDNSRKVRVEARELAIQEVEQRVEYAKRRLMARVATHPVTEELENGEVEGSSLVGGATLFSYVGFHEGSQPAKDILPFLDKTIRVKREEVRKVQGKLTWSIPIQFPELEDFDTGGIAEIPWLGKSFISQIEGGIPGMANFLYFKQPIEKSRSKHGLQSKLPVNAPVNSVENVKAKYMSPLLDDFANEIR